LRVVFHLDLDCLCNECAQVLSYDVPGVSSTDPGNMPTTGGGFLALAGTNFGTQSYSGSTRISGNIDGPPSNVNGGEIP
jgi:hypothetical protein